MARYIVTADWHIRQVPPVCRTENEKEWYNFQMRLLSEIEVKCVKNASTLIVAGDIFHRSFPGMNIINSVSEYFSTQKIMPIVIAGNHDLPYHNFDLVYDSGFGNFLASGLIPNIGNEKIFLENFNQTDPKYTGQEIVVCHYLCFENEKTIPPNVKAITADDLLEKFPRAKWIFCGDNHTGFHYQKDGRHVIVPGSIYIEAADRKDYEPKVWLVDTDTGAVEIIKLQNPIENISDLHIEEKEERVNRIESFIESLQRNNGMSLSFLDNLERKLATNIVSEVARTIVYEIIEETKGEK